MIGPYVCDTPILGQNVNWANRLNFTGTRSHLLTGRSWSVEPLRYHHRPFLLFHDPRPAKLCGAQQISYTAINRRAPLSLLFQPHRRSRHIGQTLRVFILGLLVASCCSIILLSLGRLRKKDLITLQNFTPTVQQYEINK